MSWSFGIFNVDQWLDGFTCVKEADYQPTALKKKRKKKKSRKKRKKDIEMQKRQKMTEVRRMQRKQQLDMLVVAHCLREVDRVLDMPLERVASVASDCSGNTAISSCTDVASNLSCPPITSPRSEYRSSHHRRTQNIEHHIDLLMDRTERLNNSNHRERTDIKKSDESNIALSAKEKEKVDKTKSSRKKKKPKQGSSSSSSSSIKLTRVSRYVKKLLYI